MQVNGVNGLNRKVRSGFRFLGNEDKALMLNIMTVEPMATNLQNFFCIDIPVDATTENDVQISKLDEAVIFSARVDELLPVPTGTITLRMQLFVERMIREMLQDVAAKAEIAKWKGGQSH